MAMRDAARAPRNGHSAKAPAGPAVLVVLLCGCGSGQEQSPTAAVGSSGVMCATASQVGAGGVTAPVPSRTGPSFSTTASAKGRVVAGSTSGPTRPTVSRRTAAPKATTSDGAAPIDAWVSHTNAACSTAISRYQAGKAGTDDPSAKAALAAAAVGQAAAQARALTPPDASTTSLSKQLDALAAAQARMAQAMNSGSVDDEMAALAAVESAGHTVAATANRVGAPACAQMTTDV